MNMWLGFSCVSAPIVAIKSSDSGQAIHDVLIACLGLATLYMVEGEGIETPCMHLIYREGWMSVYIGHNYLIL